MLDLKKIKDGRERLDLTMEQAAERAGFTTRQQWYLIESGRRSDVTMTTLEKIAKALEVDPRDLLLPSKTTGTKKATPKK